MQPPAALLGRMVTIRMHLDETPAENGALRVIPGSHRRGILSSVEVAEWDKGGSVNCECGRGDVILMSPLLLHSSRRSQVPRRRRVIHLEYARRDDLDEALEWYEAA